jgi:hypothetical protein
MIQTLIGFIAGEKAAGFWSGTTPRSISLPMTLVLTALASFRPMSTWKMLLRA